MQSERRTQAWPAPSIRRYRASDLEDVALLFTESVHTLGPGPYDGAQLDAWAPRPPDLGAWRARLAPLETWVAEIGPGLAGFISCERRGHLEFLYVSPGCARRGVASALYRQAEAALASAGVGTLTTEASLIARPFFARQGFRIVAEEAVHRGNACLRRFRMGKALDERPGAGGIP